MSAFYGLPPTWVCKECKKETDNCYLVDSKHICMKCYKKLFPKFEGKKK